MNYPYTKSFGYVSIYQMNDKNNGERTKVMFDRIKRMINHKALGVVSVALAFSMFAAGCGRPSVTLIAKSFSLEQGYAMPEGISNYVKGKDEELAKCKLDASDVDYGTVGEYRAKIIHPDKTLLFTVNVVDTVSPKVELYSNEISVAPGQAIDIASVVKSASDNTDFEIGFSDDITKADADKVLASTVSFSETGAHNSEVCARDKYGNMTVISIIVMVVTDSEPPVLSGVGQTVYTTVGNAVDLLKGVTATDNIDGDITSRISADTSAVDFNTAGTYTAVLTVRDGSGNEATATVDVVVQDFSQVLNPNPTEQVNGDFASYSTENVPFGFGKEVDENNRPTGLQWYINKFGKYAVDFMQPESNYIFLTFDEGYENGYTAQILDTLKEKGVKATFFVTLPYAKDNPELVRRMIDEGHVVGNHSATHPSDGLATLSVDKQLEELTRVHEYVRDNYNYEMYLFRFPTGAFSEQSLAIVQSLGYRSVFWSFAHRDWYTDDQPDVAESLKYAVDRAHGGAIYLLHAVSSTNTAMLGDFIDQCRAKGFEFGYYGKTN